jgi:hypothetical protein
MLEWRKEGRTHRRRVRERASRPTDGPVYGRVKNNTALNVDDCFNFAGETSEEFRRGEAHSDGANWGINGKLNVAIVAVIKMFVGEGQN